MNDEFPTIPVTDAPGGRVARDQCMSGELRSGKSFEDQLMQLVETQMKGHLDAGSVDEWHHTVLDDLIARAVAVEVLRIEDAGSARRVELEAKLGAAEISVDELGKRAKEAADMVGAAQVRVARAEGGLRQATADTAVADVADQGGPARLAQVVAQTAELRSARVATLERVGVQSARAIPEAIGIATVQAASLDRRIEEQARRCEQARVALERLASAASGGAFNQDAGGVNLGADLRPEHGAGPSAAGAGMVEVAA